jgi:hypothetical protein
MKESVTNASNTIEKINIYPTWANMKSRFSGNLILSSYPVSCNAFTRSSLK